MTAVAGTTLQVQPDRSRLRRWLMVPAACVTIFGALHHLDHMIRGNHTGWPLREEVTPFTLSLLIYFFLIPGLYLTARGRAWAGYWLAVALPLLALVGSVHFLPGEDTETLAHVYLPYAQPLEYAARPLEYAPAGVPAERVAFFRDVYPRYASPLWGVLAVGDLVALVLSLLVLLGSAIRARLLSGRWSAPAGPPADLSR